VMCLRSKTYIREHHNKIQQEQNVPDHIEGRKQQQQPPPQVHEPRVLAEKRKLISIFRKESK